jgi:hypothetical protein
MLMGRRQALVGRYWGQLPPLGRPRVFVVLVVLGVLLICFITAIAAFGVIYVAASLFICALVLPLVSSLWLLPSVLTSKWRAMSELLQPDGTSPVNLRVGWLNRVTPKSWRAGSKSRCRRRQRLLLLLKGQEHVSFKLSRVFVTPSYAVLVQRYKQRVGRWLV